MDNPTSVGFLTKDELKDALKEEREDAERDSLTGVQFAVPVTMYATPSNGTVAIGTNYPLVAPSSGYSWSVMRLSCTGLGTGATPDILNVYRNGTNTAPVWQLNGNSWGYTFGPGELVYKSGQNLQAMSVGSMVSTLQVTLTADVISLPTEKIGELLHRG